MAKYNNDIVSEYTPRAGNAFSRWFGDVTLKLMGWKITGQLPNKKQIIIIGAPHTSNWDLILAMGAMLSVGLKFSWMMKKEAFFWPLGPLWKKLGGIPIERKAQKGVVQQMSEWFETHENVWLGITPEGTRSKVDAFKKGYLRMAYGTGVPLFIVGIKADTKEVVLDKIWDLSFDIEQDNKKIKAYFDEHFIGIRPELG
jgi:1-acyl-sn-glycerol-3-phosphate acyltransferase